MFWETVLVPFGPVNKVMVEPSKGEDDFWHGKGNFHTFVRNFLHGNFKSKLKQRRDSHKGRVKFHFVFQYGGGTLGTRLNGEWMFAMLSFTLIAVKFHTQVD